MHHSVCLSAELHCEQSLILVPSPVSEDENQDKSLNCLSGWALKMWRRGEVQQSADWLGSLEQAIL